MLQESCLQSSWETLLKCTRAKDALNERDVPPNADLIYLTENLFMTLFLTASSFYSIFTQVPATFLSTEALQEVSRSVLETLAQFFWSQFVLFLHVLQTDWWRSDQISESHWNITINGQMNVWKYKLIFPTDTLQQNIEITDLKPYFTWWKY